MIHFAPSLIHFHLLSRSGVAAGEQAGGLRGCSILAGRGIHCPRKSKGGEDPGEMQRDPLL